jgi:hypothetical protein
MSSTHCPPLESLACANPDCVLYTQVGQSNLTDLLEIYSRLLEWEKYPILIFYEDAIAATQGFSQTFLHTLTRFDATICLITDLSHRILPTFSPQDPHPIQSILIWLQRTLLQN